MINQFRKCVVLLSVLTVVTFTSSAQEVGSMRTGGPVIATPGNCPLLLSSLPPFVGLQIGMSYDEVRAIYPEIQKEKHFHRTFDADGNGLFTIQAENVSNVSVREDAAQITLNFMDEKLRAIEIVYKPNKWTSIQEAVGEYSKRLGVDEIFWKLFDNRAGELKCLDFTFFANSSSGGPAQMNSISIHTLINGK